MSNERPSRLHALITSISFRHTLLLLVACASAVLFLVTQVRSARAQGYNVCYDLLEPIWYPPSYTDVIECRNDLLLCFLAPHCCLPDCRMHPECTITRQLLVRPGYWQYTSCEVLPPAKILDLFLRGQLHVLDDVVLPGVQQAAFIHVTDMKGASVPVPLAVQPLYEQLLKSQVGAGLPSFDMGHVQRARLVPRSLPTASLYLRPGFDAITLNDLIIVNDTDFNTLMGTSIPTNATLAAMRSGGTLFAFRHAFELLAHELVHVRQYDELGPDAFVNNYLLETLTKGYGSDSFEREANAYKSAVRTYLSSSPPAIPTATTRQRCVQACGVERNTCMASVAGDDGPRPGECVAEYRRCLRACPP